MKKIINVGIIGMGGFAGAHHRSVLNLENDGECRLICTCDPRPDTFKTQMTEWAFEGRGVRVFNDYIEMLDACADQLDVVAVPTPVPLHAPMHKACVERGLPVYLEKPPTLDFQELDAMLKVELSARKLTQVGFNHIAEAPRRAIKQRLVAGEFGRLIEVGYRGLWPRTDSYFKRADWAGRLMLNGRLVLDSCMGNAMAHHVHNLLFWAGWQDVWEWAQITAAEAELYRAHDIQGTDTLFVKAELHNEVRLVAALSHACIDAYDKYEWLNCEKARICWQGNDDGLRIEWHDGRQECVPPEPIGLIHNLKLYYDYLRGDFNRPMTRLADTRPFVELCDLVYVAAKHITQVTDLQLRREKSPETGDLKLEITGIETAANRFFELDEWPSEQNLPWAAPGGRAEVSELPALNQTITQMTLEHPELR